MKGSPLRLLQNQCNQLLQQERRRLSFIKQYRAAYGPVCIATGNLDVLLQIQKSKLDSQNAKQRHNTVADIEDSLHIYYDAVAHLVLNILPGQMFIKVYAQEDSIWILQFQQAESEWAASCLSTHLPLHIYKELASWPWLADGVHLIN